MIFTNIYTYLILGVLIILLMSAYLGSKLKFYDKYAWWDRLIHFLTGILSVSFGVAISRGIVGLNKLHILFFCITLSVTIHVIWEIGEYIIDCKMRGNNQRWQREHNSINHNPPNAIQPAGLVDTMNDTITCIVGTLIACAVWWFVL